ncbi:MAG: hypothetical protein ACPL4E_06255 [Thermoproteota archaeon]
MKQICVEHGFLVKEKDIRIENIYDQFGMRIETLVVEWTYPFRMWTLTEELFYSQIRRTRIKYT